MVALETVGAEELGFVAREVFVARWAQGSAHYWSSFCRNFSQVEVTTDRMASQHLSHCGQLFS